MPVSYNLRDKLVSMHGDIEPQSLEIVQRMLSAGEISSLSLIQIDINLLPLLNLTHIKEVSISDMPCYDLRFLSSIKELRSLQLGFGTSSFGKKIRLNTVPGMDTLISLTLSGVRGLENLPELINLRELNLLSIKNENFDFLDSYPNIRDLFISRSHLEGYNMLLSCKHLTRLRIIQVRKIDFAGMMAGGTVNHSLKILEISHCPSLTDFSFLRFFPELKYMDITSCRNLISFKGIEDCRKLEIINISESKVRDKTLKCLVNIRKIFVMVSYTKDEVALFEKEFKGEVYSLGRFDKGTFDFLDYYTKYYSKSLDTLSEV